MSENEIADENQSIRGPLEYSVETSPQQLEADGKKSFRGPLKYSVETSAPQLEAGRNTTIFLLITNPYDVPVEILSVQPRVPAQFRESAKVPFWEQLWKEAKDEVDLEDLQAVSGVTLSDKNKNFETPSSVILRSGNTTIYEFRIRTRQALLFTPAIHNLNAQVQYKMDGHTNYDTVKYQLNIRAPLKALIYGSVIGSIVGTILRSTNEGLIFTPLDLKGYVPFGTSILVGIVLVIAFARKKDAQPFITIEDFFGGFFIGFLAGYVGKSMLDSLASK